MYYYSIFTTSNKSSNLNLTYVTSITKQLHSEEGDVWREKQAVFLKLD